MLTARFILIASAFAMAGCLHSDADIPGRTAEPIQYEFSFEIGVSWENGTVYDGVDHKVMIQVFTGNWTSDPVFIRTPAYPQAVGPIQCWTPSVTFVAYEYAPDEPDETGRELARAIYPCERPLPEPEDRVSVQLVIYPNSIATSAGVVGFDEPAGFSPGTSAFTVAAAVAGTVWAFRSGRVR